MVIDKPAAGMHVKLSKEGYSDGLIISEEDAAAAKSMIIIKVEQMGPDVYAIDVTGPLNRYLLHNGHFDIIVGVGNSD